MDGPEIRFAFVQEGRRGNTAIYTTEGLRAVLRIRSLIRQTGSLVRMHQTAPSCSAVCLGVAETWVGSQRPPP